MPMLGCPALQDASGQRITRTEAGCWKVEAACLPAVSGSAEGVQVQPCPGLGLSWAAASGTITLQLPGGCCLSVAPGGLLGLSAPGNGADHVAAFEAAAMAVQQAVPEGPQAASGEAAEETPAAQRLLQQLSGQAGCHGIYCFQLPAGHAAMHDSEACQLALTADGGEPAVWRRLLPDSAAAPSPAASFTAVPAASEGAEPASAAGEQEDTVRQEPAVRPSPLSLPPRLFVIDATGSSGYELLDRAAFERCLRSQEASDVCTISRRPLVNANQEEPGAVSWCFISRHAQRDGHLQDLPVYCGVQPMPYSAQGAGPGAVPGLRKPSTFRCGHRCSI